MEGVATVRRCCDNGIRLVSDWRITNPRTPSQISFAWTPSFLSEAWQQFGPGVNFY